MATATTRFATRVGPLDAFVRARQVYLRGRRIDMQDLSLQLGVGRATLYRWFGSRERLIGEILWSLAELGIQEAEAIAGQAGLAGAERIVAIYQHLLERTANHWPIRQHIANEREAALRLLTSNEGVQHQRLIDYLRGQLEAESEAGRLDLKLDPADLAYILNRVAESFIWRQFFTGEEPDTAKAAVVARLLLA